MKHKKIKIYNLVEKLIVKSTDLEASQLLFSMATHFRHTLQHSKSIEFFRELCNIVNIEPFLPEDKKLYRKRLMLIVGTVLANLSGSRFSARLVPI